MFDFVKDLVKKQIQDTIDANNDGELTADDLLVVGAVLIKKGLPYVERKIDEYLESQGVTDPNDVLIDLP